MNLAIHLFKKDIRRSRILLSTWLLLVLLQCALIGSSVNPGDRLIQALYSSVSVLVPLLQGLMLVVIIPQVVQEEPLVGTTAFWFTRPISRATLLKSKTMFALLVLVIPPLVAELIVLAANGVTGHDLSLAAPQIVMMQLVIIIPVAVYAVITPNFARFALLWVVIIVTMLLLQTAFMWATIYFDPQRLILNAGDYSLNRSRSVVGDLFIILAGCAVVAHQYLTRRTARTVATAIMGMAVATAAFYYWPLDFWKTPAIGAGGANFDTAAMKTQLVSDVTASNLMAIRGQGSPQKTVQAEIDTTGLPKGYVVQIQAVHPRLTSPDGHPLMIKEARIPLAGSEPDSDALAPALGGIPIVNPSTFSPVPYIPLFTMGADTYSLQAGKPLIFSAGIDFVASKYVLVAEMPLVKGGRYDHGSEHVVITDVLKQPEGVDIYLRQRKLNLLFAPGQNPDVTQPSDQLLTVYVLLNRKRNEAVVQKQNNGFSYNVVMGSQMLMNQPLSLSYGPDQNHTRLSPDLSPEWLADATLARLELKPVAAFSKQLVVDKFLLAGSDPSSVRNKEVKADPETLRKIVLPENATKIQAEEYIKAVLVASQKQNRFSDNDPQVGMLQKVGSENLDLLIKLESLTPGGPRSYLSSVIQRLVRPEDKELILKALPFDHELVEIVVKFGWQADARDALISGLEQKDQYFSDNWIKAVVSFQDPATYPALKSYFSRSNDKLGVYNDIKQLPGIDLSDVIEDAWKKARYSNSYEMLQMGTIAASTGHLDAVEAAAGFLKKDKNQYQLKLARQIITQFTPATGDDAALIAWFQANKDKLTFDPQSKKFVLR